MKKREEIESKYTWDLTKFYNSEVEIEKDIEKLKDLNGKIVSLKGKLCSSDAIFSYFKIAEESSILSERLGSFIMLKLALNGKDKMAMSLESKLSRINTKLSKQTAFVAYELAQNDSDFLLALLQEARFSNYDVDIKEIIRCKPHTLSEEKEKLLTGIGEFSNQDEVFSLLTDVDFKFEDVINDKGEKVGLTNANYSSLMSNNERNVRKQTYENLLKVYASHNLSLSTNYISILKRGQFFAEEYNFKSKKQMKFFSDEMPEKVLDVLMKSVNNNLKDYQDYYRLRKNVLNLKDYYLYDNYVSIVSEIKIEPSYEEAVDIFKKAVSCMGKKYLDFVDNQVANRYIDVYETENKDSGAFNADLNICNPYVLLNFEPNFYWLSTLAHEFGHMVNTCLINSTQPLSKRGCSIFAAEIASTVNECLLHEYLLESTNDNKLKIFLLDKFVKDFNATVFRQTMFTEFEVFAHGMIEQEKPIIYDDLNNFYDNLQKKYFGKDVVLTKNDKFEWSRIPHFYRPFYVYSYATGLISASIIVGRIKKEGKPFVDKYIEFLSSGESDTGFNTLKRLGIDICDEKTFEEGFLIYKHKLSQLKTLLEGKC